MSKSKKKHSTEEGKQLLLVRHAKSSWDDISIKDFDRPLNDRGKKDAPDMAKRLKDQDIEIDAFVSSPAKRARKTAEAFIKEFDEKKGDILFTEKLYLASPSAFYEVISELDDKLDTVAIFSHNEGITSFANMLTETRVDNIPTCGVFAVKVKTEHWADFEKAEKEFWFFDFPKSGKESE